MALKDGCNSIFSSNLEEIQGIWKELGLKQSVIEKDIDMILEWFEKQPHLMTAGLPDRDFLERMLIQAKGSVEKTKQRLDNHYRLRSLAPELVQNRPEYLESSKDLFTYYRQLPIAKLFEHKRLTFIQFTESDPNSMDICIILKNSMIILDIRMKYDYMLSDVWVLDLTNVTWSHVMRVDPGILAKTAQLYTEGYGVRVFAIHVLGMPSYVDQLSQFFSKFIKAKLMKRVIYHHSVDDLRKSIPKEYLPEDYGGDQPSFAFGKEKLTELLKREDTKKFLEENSKQISDETKRPKDFLCEDYLPGTFKKLELD